LLSEEERISVDAFADVIHRIKATFITILPTVFFNQVATYLSEEDAKKLATVKKVAVGGEALTGEIVRAFQRKFQNSIEVINLYGPTESTVVATGHRVTNLVPEHQVNIPIGKPFSNYAVYIVNEENQLCPINVPGEIYISSLALAKGYLNQEAKTKEVFIDNPFKTNSVIYKSGDIGRILEDGVIEYVGRKDSQVKVRGHRIEIGEIEDSLAKYPQIQDVVIIPKKDHGNGTILVGYYTSKNDQKIKTTKLKEFLLEKLPSYMVPQYINQLEEMPISPTGKVDRKKLATFEVLQTEKNEHYVAPKNEIQQIIAYTWKQVLNLEQVSTDDDFFEIGGDSIKIMSVLVLLKPYFPQLKISDFFTHKTIEELAIRVKEVKREDQNAYKNKEQGAWEIKDMNEYPAGINNHRQLYTYKNPKNILLTGSTGYLGSHILYELMQSTNAKVYCLLRKTTHKTIKEKLVNTMQGYFGKEIIRMINERVVFIEGDLEKDQLGLGLCDQKMIKENIDTIIHAAADVRHFGDSTHFEKVNIQGTKHILDIAKSKQDIRFHYVSTLGIPEDLSLSGKWEEVISKPKFDENLKLENVYTNSKLAAEKLVYQAGEEGIAINVYRAGNLTCRSDNGYFQKNIDSNAFYRMIKAMLLLGKAPKANCYLDFTPIDYASKVIVDLIYQQNSIGETFHICNPEQILYSSMIDMICEFGYDVELIDQIEYEEYLFDENQYKNPEGIELAIAQLDGDGVKDSCYRFSCSNTKKYLDPAYFQYTQIDQNFIDNMLKYGIEAGYFPTREYCVARNKQGEKVG
jgi:thioester reductase-like protein